jgi:hypothetical protein
VLTQVVLSRKTPITNLKKALSKFVPNQALHDFNFTVHGNSTLGVPSQPLCFICLVKWNLRLNRLEQVLHPNGLLTRKKQELIKEGTFLINGIYYHYE